MKVREEETGSRQRIRELEKEREEGLLSNIVLDCNFRNEEISVFIYSCPVCIACDYASPAHFV